jgi:uncharacterized protein YycO
MLILFTSSNTLGSYLIRKVDGGEYSHCLIIQDNDVAIEATATHGVQAKRKLPALMEDSKAYALFWLPSDTEDQGREAIRFALGQVGKPYDYMALPSIAIRHLFDTSPHWEDKNRWYCDELMLATMSICNANVRKLVRGWPGRFGVEAARNILIDSGASLLQHK